ncbi:hypothetical protein AURANDRAFT_23917 [Aureococcus anophagefferens]|uniref:Sel1 repeat family protein n=1 Tax=Aureococcus anophagefferens TaxID=44056 RepID=F0Y5H8_AURAN|nr:hypothetical protein AURANDRAFT_23917 [Aureococcus anophagefferens]EGB09495.1 hypothetical protein AURANDRAFT_23917 [Aureococcus anophagefferens]|eukprot:XP_009035559.1 hypothetical protein AURANDRAFT_23917 [Aureococcus anophagefferens]
MLARLRRHVENEVPEAISFLGGAYREGRLGLVKSEKKAAKIWKRAVELGDVDAMVFIGEMHEEGSGVKLDKKKAMKLYRAAADRGSAVAQTNLAILLCHEKKFEEAFRYFALAADRGYTPGEINLGICYRNGQGTEVDLGKARYWFERGAAKGHEKAIEILARPDWTIPRLYVTGSGVKLDKKKAMQLFRTAADLGSAVAQTNLGVLLYSEKRFEEAFRYYALAANQGFTPSENNLGICYMDGAGTEVDLGKARYWLERAAAKGEEQSIEALASDKFRAT